MKHRNIEAGKTSSYLTGSVMNVVIAPPHQVD